MKTAHGYVRVSRDREHEKLSPVLQRRRITDYCSAKGWRLVKVYEDINIPGSSFDRPGWSVLMAEVKPGDVIVTNEFTRIGRNLRESLIRIDDLHEGGVEIASLEGELDTTTASGKVHLNMLLVLAQFERDRMSERFKQVHEQIARQGTWCGGPPALGYSYTSGAKVLEVEPAEAETVRLIYSLRDRGWSIHSIVRHLAEQGIKGKRGRMNYTSVRSVLRNPVYVSKRLYAGEMLPMNHESLIPEEIWKRVQARNRRGAYIDRKYLLSGFLTCGDCGSPMVHQSQGPGGRQYYVCKGAIEYQQGRRIAIEEHCADKWVTERFLARIDPARLEAAEKRIQARLPKQEPRLAEIRTRLERTEAALDRLLADYYDSDIPPITPEQFRDRNAKLSERRDALLAEAESIRDVATLDTLRPPKDLLGKWGILNLDEKREALRLFIERVTVLPCGPGKRGVASDSSRLRVKWKK